MFLHHGWVPGVGNPPCQSDSQIGRARHIWGIDSVEQALRDLTGIDVESEGYRLAYRIVADNLSLRHLLVADPCNPITRPAMSGGRLQKTWRPDNDTSTSCVRTSLNTGVGLSIANQKSPILIY